MNIKMNVVFMGFFLLALAHYTPARAQPMGLSEQPCSALLMNMRGIDGRPKTKADLNDEYSYLWAEQTSIFRKTNPEAYRDNMKAIDAIGGSYENVFSFVFQKACQSGDANETVGEKIQAALLKQFKKKPRKKRLVQDGCKIIAGKDAEFFDLTGPPIHICTDVEFVKSRFAGPSGAAAEKYKDQKVVQFCIWKTNSDQEEEPLCKIIEGTKEQQCLSAYGACRILITGTCGWAHTVKSRSCL